jgi:hypothetical protein
MLATQRAILGLTLLFATIGGAFGQSQRRPQQVRVKQPETAVTQGKTNEDQRGTEQSPFIVKVAPAPKTDDERAEETKERDRIANADRKKEESDTKVVEYTGELAFFTKSLFIATAALVFATLGLCVAAFRQSRDMKSSIAVATKAANAAKASADAVVIQLRAYASVMAASIRGFEQNGPFRIQIRIANHGQTPAYELTHEHGFTHGEANISRFKGELWPPERDVPLSKTTLASGISQDAVIDIPAPLRPEVKTAIRVGTHGLFAYGEIRYRDAFGNWHVSTYRLMYGGGSPITDDKFTACEEGNYED